MYYPQLKRAVLSPLAGSTVISSGISSSYQKDIRLGLSDQGEKVGHGVSYAFPIVVEQVLTLGVIR